MRDQKEGNSYFLSDNNLRLLDILDGNYCCYILKTRVSKCISPPVFQLSFDLHRKLALSLALLKWA